MKKIDINPAIFRGYDIRGVADKDLTPEIIGILGKAYATFLHQRQINEAVVGMDIRLTSPAYKKALVKALIESGINVIDIGLSLTQIVYYAQYHFRSKGAAMISASHNPKEYNGLKLAVGFSDTLISQEIQQIRQIAESGKFSKFPKQGSYKKVDVFPDYQQDLIKRLPLKNLKYKIVIDAISATPGAFLPQILSATGSQVIERNTKPDGNFPLGTPDPTESEHMERLSGYVLKEKADLGLTYDADGDRIGVVDGSGRIIWNDVLLALFAKDIIHYLPKSPIVFNTLCSKVVSDSITKAGGKPIIWITGHSFIKAKVKEVRAPFGGELSGHFFFMDNFYGHDDGAFASLRLLSYLNRTGQTLAAAVDKLPKYFSSPEIKLGLPDEVKFQVIKDKFTPALKKLYPQAEYIHIDGIRMDTKETMAVIRASQNGPYITIKFEGKTQKQYSQLKKELKKLLKENKDVDWSYGVNTDSLK